MTSECICQRKLIFPIKKRKRKRKLIQLKARKDENIIVMINPTFRLYSKGRKWKQNLETIRQERIGSSWKRERKKKGFDWEKWCLSMAHLKGQHWKAHGCIINRNKHAWTAMKFLVIWNKSGVSLVFILFYFLNKLRK